MKMDDIENRELVEYLRDRNSVGQIKAFGAVWLTKASYDERFDLLFGESAYGKDPLRSLSISSATKVLGLYDTETEQIYEPAYVLDRGEDYADSFKDVMRSFNEEIEGRVADYMNDPKMRDELVGEAERHQPGYEGYVGDDTLENLFLSGATIEDVLNDKPTWEFEKESLSDVIAALEKPQEYVEEQVQGVIEKPENRILMGRKLIYHELLVEQYKERLENVSPNLAAKKKIEDALVAAFDDEKVGSLWLTAAKDGKEARFQYPEKALLYGGAENTLGLYNVKTPAQREMLESIFGNATHAGCVRKYDNPEITATDIVKIEYGRKTVYEVGPDVLAEKLDAITIPVSLYTPDEETHEQLYSVSNNSRRQNYPAFDIKFDVSTTAPQDFVFKSSFEVTVGAYSDAQTMFSDVYKQLAKEVNIHKGDLLAAPGKTIMVDDYVYYKDMPFALDVSIKEQNRDVDHGGKDSAQCSSISGMATRAQDAIGDRSDTEIEKTEELDR